jgi:hypothetical protein
MRKGGNAMETGFDLISTYSFQAHGCMVFVRASNRRRSWKLAGEYETTLREGSAFALGSK